MSKDRLLGRTGSSNINRNHHSFDQGWCEECRSVLVHRIKAGLEYLIGISDVRGTQIVSLQLS